MSQESKQGREIAESNGNSPREFDPRTREHWALINSTQLENRKLAIFVHGFRGDFLSTWGKLPEMLVEKADSDLVLKEWDFLFVGYETSQIASYLDIADRICTEWRRSSEGADPYPRPYTYISLFGHSLGTLGIRQLLAATVKHHTNVADAIWSITLFGSPLNGSKLATFGKPLYKIAEALAPNNPQARMLKVWTEGSYTQHPWPTVKVVSGQGDWVTGDKDKEFANWPGDAPIYTTTLDHSDLSKPTGWSNSVVLDHIRYALKSRTTTR